MNSDLYIEDTNQEFDVIVVGSGISGGWAAKEFTERGFKVLMIERGRVVKHREDYVGENKKPWESEFRLKVSTKDSEEQKIQTQCYAYNDHTKQFFGNDKDLPYSTEEGKPFTWIRANQLGGKSLLWHRQSYRMSNFDFAANKADGYGIDWPIRYKDLAPWYSYAERFAGISGSVENLPQLPDGVFQKPFELNKPEKDFAKSIAGQFPDRKAVVGRAAHLTQPTKEQLELGRSNCFARDRCQKGCSFGAYFSTQSATLPAAVRTNNLSIAPNSVVASLIYSEQNNRVKGVNVIDNETLKERQYFGKTVFLCASTLGSTQILLNSTSRRFPKGLANSSGVLGHYLMDHNYNAGATADLEGYGDIFYRGNRPTNMYLPNFYYEPKRYNAKFVRGYALGIMATRKNWVAKGYQSGLGLEFKNHLREPGRWQVNMSASGEMLPRYENSVSLHPSKKDKWGIPQLHMDIQWSKNELDMMEDAAEQSRLMLEKFGATNIDAQIRQGAPGLVIHEVGTARMGNDPKESVLNGFNQSHDVPNLFVTDGSSFCSSGTQNPSMTFMALTIRAVDYASKQMKAKQI